MIVNYPVIPALKATVARFSGDESWRTVRPPLMALTDKQAASLAAELDELGFDMPGLAG